jgi:serine/threonine-protein kinase HipA
VTRPRQRDEWLAIFANGQPAGTLVRNDTHGGLDFYYLAPWFGSETAYPLSLDLPLGATHFRDETIAAHLRGLLPDSPARLARVAAAVGVRADDPFGLLTHYGEDCPGAYQFVQPDRTGLIGGEPLRLEWLTDATLAERLRALAPDGTSAGSDDVPGWFSLPGALPKLSLRWDTKKERWGLPQGRAASTHIAKLPLAGLRAHAENEHLCLALARVGAGLAAARSRILRVEDQTALVVERFDRARRGREIVRVHQEDFGLALGGAPEIRYPAQGAPGLQDMIALLRKHTSYTSPEVARLVQSVAFNWLIGGADAHLRNYAVLIEEGARVSLAPLFDLASAAMLDVVAKKPGRGDDERFAMNIGGAGHFHEIGRAEWAVELAAASLDVGASLEAILALGKRTLEALPAVVAAEVDAGDVAADIGADFVARVGRFVKRRIASL